MNLSKNRETFLLYAVVDDDILLEVPTGTLHNTGQYGPHSGWKGRSQERLSSWLQSATSQLIATFKVMIYANFLIWKSGFVSVYTANSTFVTSPFVFYIVFNWSTLLLKSLRNPTMLSAKQITWFIYIQFNSIHHRYYRSDFHISGITLEINCNIWCNLLASNCAVITPWKLTPGEVWIQLCYRWKWLPCPRSITLFRFSFLHFQKQKHKWQFKGEETQLCLVYKNVQWPLLT